MKKLFVLLVALLVGASLSAEKLPKTLQLAENGKHETIEVSCSKVNNSTFKLSNGMKIVSEGDIPGQIKTFKLYQGKKKIGRLIELDRDRPQLYIIVRDE